MFSSSSVGSPQLVAGSRSATHCQQCRRLSAPAGSHWPSSAALVSITAVLSWIPRTRSQVFIAQAVFRIAHRPSVVLRRILHIYVVTLRGSGRARTFPSTEFSVQRGSFSPAPLSTRFVWGCYLSVIRGKRCCSRNSLSKQVVGSGTSPWDRQSNQQPCPAKAAPDAVSPHNLGWLTSSF